MKDFKFSGEEQIILFDFLNRLVEDADTLDVSEGQLMVCLWHMLTKTAAREYRSISSKIRAGGLSY